MVACPLLAPEVPMAQGFARGAQGLTEVSR